MNHPDFSTLDDAEIEREIDGMERMFAAAGLPKPVTFAYPGGPFCERAAAILRQRGYLACLLYTSSGWRSAGSGRNGSGDFPSWKCS